MAYVSRAAFRRVRSVHLIVGFAVFLILSLTSTIYETHRTPSIYRYTDGRTPRAWKDIPPPKKPSVEAQWVARLIQQYGLSKDIQYYARRIRPTVSSSRQSMTDTGTNFQSGGFRGLRLDRDSGPPRLRQEKVLTLPVMKSQKREMIDASSLLFGISSTYSRITHANDSLINDWRMWLTDGKGMSNGASLLLTLYKADDRDILKAGDKLRTVGIDAVVTKAAEGLDGAGRYMDLIRQLSAQKITGSTGPVEKKFLALVDDDVFLPNVAQLLKRLGRYDHTKEFYIGLPSERSDWVIDSDVTATYGGGVVFLTPPAAVKLAQLQCTSQKRSAGQWDDLLYQCVSNHTSLDFHVMPSLYSPADDTYGLSSSYELGAPPLTLHHYGHRHRFSPGKASLVSQLYGEECFLQRYRFNDNWILVNGFSLSHYPEGQDVVSLARWQSAKPGLEQQRQQRHRPEYALPVNEKIVIDDDDRRVKDLKIVTWAGSKRTWTLLDSAVGEKGTVMQAYLRRRGAPGSYTDGRNGWDTSDADSIIVLTWEP